MERACSYTHTPSLSPSHLPCLRCPRLAPGEKLLPRLLVVAGAPPALARICHSNQLPVSLSRRMTGKKLAREAEEEQGVRPL